ncbi:MAG TPA: L,D-transpeptidase [Candidatus Methylacidiphilales bacterium]|jgi:hypothetical protein|nr:L,D-transpeptidase [Candidatus Methylacidiphilales bacterium]
MRHVSVLVLFVALLMAEPSAQASSFTKGREVAPFTPGLKAGDYVWHPEISPAGPVIVLVSLPDQVLYVYRNGVRIGRSTVSTGAKGHRTPTGVFTILQKKVDHESSIYKGAKMPHMQRLTWTGIAMHAGNLPGYPASHGCVRLPENFAEKLYTVTKLGTTVIIADNKSGPDTSTKPGLLFARENSAPLPSGAIVWNPGKAPTGPVSIIISVPDHEVYVYRNGSEIGRAPAAGLGGISGTYAYSALATLDRSGLHDWMVIAEIGDNAPNIKKLARNDDVDPQFLANLHALVTPGTSLILTDAPVDADTRSGTGFNVMTASNAQ